MGVFGCIKKSKFLVPLSSGKPSPSARRALPSFLASLSLFCLTTSYVYRLAMFEALKQLVIGGCAPPPPPTPPTPPPSPPPSSPSPTAATTEEPEINEVADHTESSKLGVCTRARVGSALILGWC